MIPVLEKKSVNSWKTFGLGFANGIGSLGNLFILRRDIHTSRRFLYVETKLRDWRTDRLLIQNDFQVAFGRLNERTQEK